MPLLLTLDQHQILHDLLLSRDETHHRDHQQQGSQQQQHQLLYRHWGFRLWDWLRQLSVGPNAICIREYFHWRVLKFRSTGNPYHKCDIDSPGAQLHGHGRHLHFQPAVPTVQFHLPVHHGDCGVLSNPRRGHPGILQWHPLRERSS